eukprot:CAMPEP_0184332524 /NCGR_PEP_ID=MMETSP1089-20130417/1684_1 /TAXON_ID=38269 ORGANISM="Gloeochaete wittrockiana, Strain SAG46.84" /NCGR_SAMPLE_ID=MMETSP1089 /ASSEMBLY_ACC=CAM_ASM_000445 /LENGTH=346 /DNA_ID=CAMNT_0026655929 /DNA_START=82 /DNA_END=1119 /DNA_ORIENTATION=-
MFFKLHLVVFNVFFLVVSVSCSPPTLAPYPMLPNDNYDVIVLAGQSNAKGVASGYGPNAPLLNVLQLLQNGSLAPAREPLSNVGIDLKHTPGQHGFAVRFANAYALKYASLDRKVVIVPCARNNTGLIPFQRRNISETWAPSASLFLNCVRRVNSLQGPNSRLVAFLWSQGESDVQCLVYGSSVCSLSLVAKGYLPHIIQLVRAFRTQVLLPGSSSVPFILNTIYSPFEAFACADNPLRKTTCIDGIIAAQKMLPLFSPEVYVVDTNGPWFPCDYPVRTTKNCTLIVPKYGNCCYVVHFGPTQTAYIADRMFELYEQAVTVTRKRSLCRLDDVTSQSPRFTNLDQD